MTYCCRACWDECDLCHLALCMACNNARIGHSRTRADHARWASRGAPPWLFLCSCYLVGERHAHNPPVRNPLPFAPHRADPREDVSVAADTTSAAPPPPGIPSVPPAADSGDEMEVEECDSDAGFDRLHSATAAASLVDFGHGASSSADSPPRRHKCRYGVISSRCPLCASALHQCSICWRLRCYGCDLSFSTSGSLSVAATIIASGAPVDVPGFCQKRCRRCGLAGHGYWCDPPPD